jgi:protein-disulfide isomerase
MDVDRFRGDLASGAYGTRVAQDVESADLSGVSGTPTFFINGQRHYEAYDIDTLTSAVSTERQRLAAIKH